MKVSLDDPTDVRSRTQSDRDRQFRHFGVHERLPSRDVKRGVGAPTFITVEAETAERSEQLCNFSLGSVEYAAKPRVLPPFAPMTNSQVSVPATIFGVFEAPESLLFSVNPGI
jgi:hypothetical protein